MGKSFREAHCSGCGTEREREREAWSQLVSKAELEAVPEKKGGPEGRARPTAKTSVH